MSWYYDHETEAIERRIDSDLSYCFEAMSDTGGFRLDDIAYVLAEITGENDGPDWHWIIAMKDHTYAHVQGGCDYTGWGCQDYGHATITVSLKEALSSVEKSSETQGVDFRKLLTLQLKGENSFGESTPERVY